MKVYDLIDSVLEVLKKYPSDTTILQAELHKMQSWLYPGLTTDDMKMVVRCKNCRFYKRYKKKGAPKIPAFYACSITKTKRDPEFYCKDGMEK